MENEWTSSDSEETDERSKTGRKPESSKLLSGGVKSWWVLLMSPIEDFLIEREFRPNVLTITTLVVSALAGYFFHLGMIFVAGVLLLAGSTFDIFDGRVARAQGLNSPKGAFFDSCVDRYSEVLIYLGLLSFFRDTFFVYVVFLIACCSMMVSYTKARAEGLGIECEVGIMQRTERIVYLGVLAAFNFLGNIVTFFLGLGNRDYLLKLSIIILCIFSFYTSIQRMTHVMKKMEEAGNGGTDGTGAVG
ncbi:MAG: CDP-alcohol phosphatidyltransferase family protein [Candidatus Dadabacteria bacterium]|nr:CDP-alcohol phosphatidyltransferase family protein [Candidatus Dadabacteria bacterium]MYA47835.1 CDP-alcohol phosphatidyltransferase family protein [Candidatus Dadabacteria bacterium]MYF47616.1 CDP-alcohol phosphatidyltransferase family protein [Candidatus Dadabacteria bacterium]MYG82570.1 CDP-alcohol phosphatidyltransferase family protein [Candidatus Dadabacteria bacterium]MYK49893.1 CDP-alcohol phosphatidyltransferase family protein [Candidatus Dadabacteria bacterium]